MIEAKQLVKSFWNGNQETKILKGVDFRVQEKEFVAIIGRSGAGKSTFLYQLSLLDEPTSGKVLIDGRDTDQMTAPEKTAFRLRNCGYVFQDYALIPELTALENVALPLLMQGMSKREAYEQSRSALADVGLASRQDNVPSNLSGGEQQRVSIARAVAHRPKILFADEPTANLDNESSATVLDIFKKLHAAGQTIIMVTHEQQYARAAEKIYRVDDGLIVGVDVLE